MNTNFETAKEQFLAGLACQQRGALAEAEVHYRRSLAALPGRASTLTNLGATLLQLERAAEALPLLDEAIAAEPGDMQAWSHRGLALAALGRDDDALTCFDRAAGAPGNAAGATAAQAAAWFQHALALARLGRPDAALQSCAKALDAGPEIGAGWALRGNLLKDLGRQHEAAAALRRAIELGADGELNRYLLASLDGRATPPQPPPGYVQGLFDGYAATFDQHLVQTLQYRAPELLVQGLLSIGRRFAAALDLGCGTGLCGPLLRPIADHLEGVDLSAAMLALAQERAVYDALAQVDITEFMQHSARRFDLVVAADVFIYVGDLDAVFAAVRRVLLPGGRFTFSAEQADGAVDFELRPSSRYAHSERGLRALAQRHGLTVDTVRHATIRIDQGLAVAGLFVTLAAPG